MKTLKFGGTSLETAEKFLQVSSIIIKKYKKTQISVVLSAPATITNYLVLIINNCIKQKKNQKKIFNKIKTILFEILFKINTIQKNYQINYIENFINSQCIILKKKLSSIKKLKECPEKIQATIVSIGEKFSINVMHELLKAKKYPSIILNPRKIFISTNNSYLNATINLKESKKKIEQLNIPKNNIILMPGFIAGNIYQELVVLGRNGSDYSAAALAACISANSCEIWTDVDGIYTSDPNIISHTKLLTEISYQEAIELAYFGAKVIHPRTLAPLQKNNIPCIIKNTLNPKGPGTLIHHNIKIDKNKIKGITSTENISIIYIYSFNNCNLSDYLSRTTLCLLSHKIKILSSKIDISQNKIHICIEKNNIIKAISEINKIFNLELKNKILKPIKILNNLSMITIVGKNIKNNHITIFKKIFSTFKKINNKILSISYNHSNISISIILYNKNIFEIIQILHSQIINKKKIINIFLLGVGGIGKKLIKKIYHQKKQLKKLNIILNLTVTANSKIYLYHKENKNFNTWNNHFIKSKKIFCLNTILKIPKKNCIINPVLIDCTASQNIAEQYINIINKGFHIISANKKSNTLKFSEYEKIHLTSIKKNKKFFYETHVGAGLPIIQNLQNMLNSGDKLISFQGILSGSMSFIFGQLDKGITLSEATKKAQNLGFTEPNPKDDLSGIDIARKILILARELGNKINLSDITIEKILPDHINKITNVKIFMQELKKIDSKFTKRVKKAKKEKKVLRFIGTIKKNGKCSVKIIEINKKNPLYYIKNGENIFVFYTKYYTPIPLILRGYGAGINVTTSGIFSDILRTVS